MTDVISEHDPAGKTAAPDQPAYELIEFLFFAYRDFVQEADAALARYGFGRAHHRVLHFVFRNPDLKVAELLDILKITKQSLGRVLRDLVEQGFIEASEGRTDRRQRLLRATPKGEALAVELSRLQTRRLQTALAAAGPGAEEVALVFLKAMVNSHERGEVERFVRHVQPPAK